MITVSDILTSSGKYPDREKLATPEVRMNADDLCKRLNKLLVLISYPTNLAPLKVSSGFRPAAVNAGIAGAAKKSAHLVGLAVDFEGQALGNLIRTRQLGQEPGYYLRACGLFMEALESTPTWCHVDAKPRTDRPNREFKP